MVSTTNDSIFESVIDMKSFFQHRPILNILDGTPFQICYSGSFIFFSFILVCVLICLVTQESFRFEPKSMCDCLKLYKLIRTKKMVPSISFPFSFDICDFRQYVRKKHRNSKKCKHTKLDHVLNAFNQNWLNAKSS